MSAIAALLTGTTRDLPPGDDFDYFTACVSEVYFGIHPIRLESGPFAADFALRDLDGVGAATISVPGGTAIRDRNSVALNPDDSLIMNLTRSPWHAEQFGTIIEVSPGMPAILDNAVEGRAHFDPKRRLILHTLRFPRDLLPQTAQDSERINSRLRSQHGGAQVAAQTRLLFELLEADQPEIVADVSRVVMGLLELVAEGNLSTTSRLENYKTAASMRLADPSYTIAHLARDQRCSIRTVQATFSAGGETFTEWAMAQRLELALIKLRAEEWSSRNVSAIALASGFADASTFYRAFRRRYGVTPGSMR